MFHAKLASSSSSPTSHLPLRHQPMYLHHHNHHTVKHHQLHNHSYTISQTEDVERDEIGDPDVEGSNNHNTINNSHHHNNDNTNDSDNEIISITLDEAIEMNQKLGFFHYRMLFLCGLAFMADALEVNLLAFLSTCAGIEWSLSNTEKASITGVVFGGIIVGSGLWGVVSDRYGRKVGFILATLVVSIGGFLTSIATSYGVLLFCRAIVGIGIGGTNVPFDLLAELMPLKHRGVFLIYIQYFWALGSIMVAGLAWLLLDNYGWRILALITVIPVAFTSVISILYLPESPRWLLSMGKVTAAEKILTDAAHLNGIQLPSFQLKSEEKVEEEESDSLLHNGTTMDYFAILKNRQIRSVAIPLWIVWSAFGFTYYGIILFVSRLYTTSSETSESCSFDYSSIFYNTLSEVVSVSISALLLESIGRVPMQVVFYIIGGLSVLLMGFPLPTIAMVLVGMIGRVSVFTSSNATWVATPELFATEYRAFGHAICLAFSKLGAFISPFIVVSHLTPFYVACILCLLNILAAIAASRLPETSGIQLGTLDHPGNVDSSIHQQKSSHRYVESERDGFQDNSPTVSFQSDEGFIEFQRRPTKSAAYSKTDDTAVINPVFAKIL